MSPRRQPAAPRSSPTRPAPARAVEPARIEHPMSEDMLSAVADRFKALGEPVRLRLLECLCMGPKDVTTLASTTAQSHANTSKHLSVLAQAGFVVRRREGNRVLYALSDQTPQAMCTVICDHVVRTAEEGLKRVRPGGR